MKNKYKKTSEHELLVLQCLLGSAIEVQIYKYFWNIEKTCCVFDTIFFCFRNI